MSPAHPRVYLVDDDSALRGALTQSLESAGMQVEPFEDGRQFLAALTGQDPGCVLLDVAMPGMSGLAVQAELKRRGVRMPIVFLTGHGDVSMAVKAIQGGAADFLEKPVHPDVLIARLRKALALDQEWRRAQEHAQAIRHRYAQLTSREQEVMGLLAKGFSSRQIAGQLGISTRTVEVHRTRVMHKMAAASLAELVSLNDLRSE